MTPGGDGVGADLPAGGLAAEDAHHGLDAGFGGGVVGLTEEALDGGDAAEADDGTVIPHDFEGVFAAVEDAGEIDVDDGVPFIEAHLGDGAVFDDGGVVDEVVETAVAGLDLSHHGLDLVGLGDIGGQDAGAVCAEEIELAGEGLGVCGGAGSAEVIEDDGGASAMEGACHLGADALRCAGDEGDFSFEVDGDHSVVL